MSCTYKNIGLSALTFGAGVLLCTILPSVALACVQAGIIIGTGVIIFVK